MSQDRNEELNELDRELAQMAQDAPDMPADFHARWTEQIRAEAANAGQAAEKTGSRRERRRQWRYVLSAAAVFIFLIGGTLITRNAENRNLLGSDALSNSVHPRETDAAQTETGAALFEDSAEPVLFAMNYAADMPAEEAVQEVTEEAYGFDAAAGAVQNSKAANAVPAAEAPAPMATAMPTRQPVPEPETADTESADAVTAEEEETEEYTGVPEEPAEQEKAQESEFVSFLKALGTFTLRTLAVLLCAAVPAVLAALAARARKKRKK